MSSITPADYYALFLIAKWTKERPDLVNAGLINHAIDVANALYTLQQKRKESAP